jgi:hypothetical protein
MPTHCDGMQDTLFCRGLMLALWGPRESIAPCITARFLLSSFYFPGDHQDSAKDSGSLLLWDPDLHSANPDATIGSRVFQLFRQICHGRDFTNEY